MEFWVHALLVMEIEIKFGDCHVGKVISLAREALTELMTRLLTRKNKKRASKMQNKTVENFGVLEPPGSWKQRR